MSGRHLWDNLIPLHRKSTRLGIHSPQEYTFARISEIAWRRVRDYTIQLKNTMPPNRIYVSVDQEQSISCLVCYTGKVYIENSNSENAFIRGNGQPLYK